MRYVEEFPRKGKAYIIQLQYHYNLKRISGISKTNRLSWQLRKILRLRSTKKHM